MNLGNRLGRYARIPAKGTANVGFIEESLGGLNFERPKFLALVDSIVSGEISRLIPAPKERLAGLGFDLLKRLCSK